MESELDASKTIPQNPDIPKAAMGRYDCTGLPVSRLHRFGLVMKNTLSMIGSTMAAVGISLMAVSCGDKEDTADNGDPGDNKSGSGKPASATVDLEAQLLGYWAPDAEAMNKELEREIAVNPGVAASKPFMEAVIANTSIHIPKKGQIDINGPGKVENATYTVTATDAATKTLTMDVVEDGDKGAGTAVVDGDTLVLTMNEMSIHLNRIDETTFKQRLENAKKQPSGIPGLPGGPPPTPGGGGPVPTPTLPGTP